MNPNGAISPQRHKGTIGRAGLFHFSERLVAPPNGTELSKFIFMNIWTFRALLCLGAFVVKDSG
jgi:hypothetical protein